MGTDQPKLPELTDDELVERFRATGRMAHFEELWHRYSRKVYGKSLKLVHKPEAAEDITGEVFLKVMRQIRTGYREGNFAGWLYTITKHECINHIRQAAVRLHAGNVDELDLSTVEDPVVAADVESVLNQLADGQRIALKLLYIERYSYEEIATLCGWPVEQVKAHVQNGKRMFRLGWNRKAMRTG